ncbi:MAG: type II toxin-antitoxin system RelE/ParE family toxin [Bryobacteraceae bacterium]
MMRIRVSRPAQRDLDEIFAYWARRASLDVADRLIEAIGEQLALLAELPQIGRRCDEIAPRVRCFPAGKYLIYYRRGRGTIQILHVVHGARDQGGAFKNR